MLFDKIITLVDMIFATMLYNPKFIVAEITFYGMK